MNQFSRSQDNDEPTQRGVDETEPSGTPDVKTDAGSSSSLRGRLGDGWIIAAMAFASIVSIGAILGWALFTGSNKSDNVGSSGSGAAPITKTLDVTLGEFFVKPASITLPKGSTLTLNVKNTGAVPHDLKVGTQVTPMLAPGKSSVLKVGVVDASVQGFCTVAGHKAAGMTFDVVVDTGGTNASTGHDMTAAPAAGGIDPNDVKIDPTAKPAKGFKSTDPASPAPRHRPQRHVPRHREGDRGGTGRQAAPVDLQRHGPRPDPARQGRRHVQRDAGQRRHDRALDRLPRLADVDGRQHAHAQPGESLDLHVPREHSGIWMYHCGTAPALHHIGNGMYGAVVIDPPDLPKSTTSTCWSSPSSTSARRTRKADLARWPAPGRGGVQRLLQPVRVRPDPGARPASASGSGC